MKWFIILGIAFIIYLIIASLLVKDIKVITEKKFNFIELLMAGGFSFFVAIVISIIAMFKGGL